MEVMSTRIRYLTSKDIDKLITFVNRLPYKIEIKGNPVLKGKQWFLFFILPDDIQKDEIFSGNID